MGRTRTRVLIAGAGPVGLTAAVELARRGVELEIVDRVGPRPDSESRALGVHARTLEVFERVGVLPRMLAAGRPIQGFAYLVAGREVTGVDVRGIDAPYPYILLLPQGAIERILLDRLAELGVRVRRPTELLTFTRRADGVRASLRAADGSVDEVDAEFLLGADGGRSTVRHLLGLDFPGRTFDGVVHLVDARLHFDGAPPPDHRGAFDAGRRTILGLGRVHDDIWRVIAYLRPDDPRNTPEPLSLEAVQSVLDEHPHLRASAWEVRWGSVYRVSNRMVQQLRHGRVLLAGDAAHVHSPMGGQGLNTGVQDVHNLAWKLAAVLDGTAAEDLLDSYDAERLPVIAAVVRETAIGHRLLDGYGRLLARPAVTPLVRATAPLLTAVLRRPRVHDAIARAVSQLAVSYPDSPIVEDLSTTGRRGLRAGHRAPDADGLMTPDGRRTRLFAELAADTAHHLLLLAGVTATDGQLAALGQTTRELQTQHPGLVVHRVLVRAPGYAAITPVAGDLHDVAVTLHDRHQLRAGGVHLIRPDGYLALRADSPIPQLDRHLHTVAGHVTQRATG